MRNGRVWLGWVLGVVLAGCGGTVEDGATGRDEALKACTLLSIECPAECKQAAAGCPRQCHCPGYTACGPDLKCGVGEVCCTGAGPVSVDPSLNQYSCNPAGTLCPL